MYTHAHAHIPVLLLFIRMSAIFGLAGISGVVTVGVGPGQNGHYHKHTIIDCKAGPPFPGHVNLPGTCADSPRCSAAEVDGLNCIWTRARVCVCLCDGSVFHCLTFGLIIKRFNWKYTGRVGAPPCLETTENGDNYTASNMRRCNLCPSIVQTVYYSWPYAIWNKLLQY